MAFVIICSLGKKVKLKRSNQKVKLKRIGMILQYNYKHSRTFPTVPSPRLLPAPTPFLPSLLLLADSGITYPWQNFL